MAKRQCWGFRNICNKRLDYYVVRHNDIESYCCSNCIRDYIKFNLCNYRTWKRRTVFFPFTMAFETWESINSQKAIAKTLKDLLDWSL